jgi:hypothetical protein
LIASGSAAAVPAPSVVPEAAGVPLAAPVSAVSVLPPQPASVNESVKTKTKTSTNTLSDFLIFLSLLLLIYFIGI